MSFIKSLFDKEAKIVKEQRPQDSETERLLDLLDNIYVSSHALSECSETVNKLLLLISLHTDTNPASKEIFIRKAMELADSPSLQDRRKAFLLLTLWIHEKNPRVEKAIKRIKITPQSEEEALADYDQTIRLEPNNASAYYGRGYLYACLQRFNEAVADFGKAIQLNPKYALAYYHRGNLYHNLGRYDEALADFEKAIQLDPTKGDVYHSRGLAYFKLEHYDKAMVDFKQAIKLKPDNAPTYYFIGGILYRDYKLQDALPYFEKAAQLGYPEGAKVAAQVKEMLDQPCPCGSGKKYKKCCMPHDN